MNSSASSAQHSNALLPPHPPSPCFATYPATQPVAACLAHQGRHAEIVEHPHSGAHLVPAPHGVAPAAFLKSRNGRVAVAVAHAAVSAMPGMLIWCACGLIDMLTRPAHWPTAATIAGATAILYVSATAWAATLKLPRHAAGVT